MGCGPGEGGGVVGGPHASVLPVGLRKAQLSITESSVPFKEHFTNTENRHYICLYRHYRPPATTNLRTSVAGMGGGVPYRVGQCREAGRGRVGGQNCRVFPDVLYGQSIRTWSSTPSL